MPALAVPGELEEGACLQLGRFKNNQVLGGFKLRLTADWLLRDAAFMVLILTQRYLSPFPDQTTSLYI